jgi:hypothetical protein
MEQELAEAQRVEEERRAAERAAAEQAEAERLAAEAEAAAAAEAVVEESWVSADTSAAAFADLNHNPLAPAVDEAEEDVTTVEVLDPEPAPVPEAGVDTAALLRELASLGSFDDDSGEQAPPPRTVKSKPATKEQPKKKKGLFGR